MKFRTPETITAEELHKMLDVIEHRILPLTEDFVRKGHNLFGGAVLDPVSLDPIVVGSNRRSDNPVFHGEVETLLRFYEQKDRPKAEETVFLATHEPCCMCFSALAWCGFKEAWYLFDYTETDKDFNMPDDLIMLKELFGSQDIRRRNSYLNLYSIKEAAKQSEDAERLMARIESLKEKYKALPVVL
ncbi:cytosine/adenosine deaminase [Thermanaerovibrio velox DSM 12556]|uniref:Cytosine/adenosine deaminase n=1 Tax=Thermanaerovibrio velox DSM 12556 TaxID=926567 RepID=H0UNZ7_9BACT|nr:deaminase [Thermanaerovibrio velox]EHM10500.1 cytosine/adenosine deaminase [Thermanaerovibrio velox DSM 12556]